MHIGGISMQDSNDGKLADPNTGQPIKYYHATVDMVKKNLDDFVSEIVKACKLRNILIFVDSVISPNAASVINEAFVKLSRNTKANNVTIINHTNSSYNVVTSIQSLRKSINIAFYDFVVYKNSPFEKDLSRTQPINRTFKVVASPYSSLSWKKRTWEGFRDKQITANFRFIPTPSTPTNQTILNSWWFKLYFAIPPCASARLTQSTGTCWMNALINCLLLSPEFLDLIRLRFPQMMSNAGLMNSNYSLIPLNQFAYLLKNNKIGGIAQMTLSLFGNLIKSDSKAKQEDGNFVGAYASIINCHLKNSNQVDESSSDLPAKCTEISFGDGGYANRAAPLIMKYILKPKIDFAIIDIEEDFKTSNPNAHKEIMSIMGKRYSSSKLALAFATDSVANALKTNGENGNLTFPKILGVKLSHRTMTNIPLQLVIAKNQVYELISSVIIIKRTKKASDKGPVYYHAIAGFRCNNQYFVYDSNNHLAKADWFLGHSGISTFFDSDPVLKDYKLIDNEIVFYWKV